MLPLIAGYLSRDGSNSFCHSHRCESRHSEDVGIKGKKSDVMIHHLRMKQLTHVGENEDNSKEGSLETGKLT